MPRCSINTFAEITFSCWVTLKSYCRNWTYCVSHINTSTVYIYRSSIDSVEILLSRVVKCFIMCKEQTNLIKETSEWIECPASQKRESWGKKTENIFWAPSRKLNVRKLVYQSVQKELNKSRWQKMNWKYWKLLIVSKVAIIVIVAILQLLNFKLFTLTNFCYPKSLKKWNGSVNVLVITAIISLSITKKPTNKHAAPSCFHS